MRKSHWFTWPLLGHFSGASAVGYDHRQKSDSKFLVIGGCRPP